MNHLVGKRVQVFFFSALNKRVHFFFCFYRTLFFCLCCKRSRISSAEHNNESTFFSRFFPTVMRKKKSREKINLNKNCRRDCASVLWAILLAMAWKTGCQSKAFSFVFFLLLFALPHSLASMFYFLTLVDEPIDIKFDSNFSLFIDGKGHLNSEHMYDALLASSRASSGAQWVVLLPPWAILRFPCTENSTNYSFFSLFLLNKQRWKCYNNNNQRLMCELTSSFFCAPAHLYSRFFRPFFFIRT